MATLIIDAGGTKVTFAVLMENRFSVVMHTKAGIVPYLLSEATITNIFLDDIIPNIDGGYKHIKAIFYYGSGCSISENRIKMENILRSVFIDVSYIFVGHDMLGAARSVCQNEKGLVAILGTGSSACVYDGKDIEVLRAGIGYILGDEGSGAFMGKVLLQKMYYESLPLYLQHFFLDYVRLTRDEIINKIYLEPAPNRFLASLAYFLNTYKNEPFIREIIESSLRLFFVNHIVLLNGVKNYPLSLIGGIAFMFQEEVRGLAQEYNIRVKKIIRNPIEGLMEYHNADLM